MDGLRARFTSGADRTTGVGLNAIFSGGLAAGDLVTGLSTKAAGLNLGLAGLVVFFDSNLLLDLAAAFLTGFFFELIFAGLAIFFAFALILFFALAFGLIFDFALDFTTMAHILS